MTCGGCSGAVSRVLSKAKADSESLQPYQVPIELHEALISVDLGVDEYGVSLEKQQMLVTGTIPYDELLEKIKKTGNEVSI